MRSFVCVCVCFKLHRRTGYPQICVCACVWNSLPRPNRKKKQIGEIKSYPLPEQDHKRETTFFYSIQISQTNTNTLTFFFPSQRHRSLFFFFDVLLLAAITCLQENDTLMNYGILESTLPIWFPFLQSPNF